MIFTKAYIRIFKVVLAITLSAGILVSSACSTKEVTGQDVTIDEIPLVTLPQVEKDPVPKIGGHLTFPMPRNSETINPLKVKNVELNNLLSLIYEQPVRIDTDGKAISELAETWEADETATTWTFKLRKGVRWQGDYGSFTADDVIYTIETLLGYSSADSRYAVYNNYIDSYVATDSYTVNITLKEPGNVAIYFMTMPILCKAYSEEFSIDEDLPIGTGPYVATDYDKRSGMNLKANEAWWKQPPFIQELSAVCYSDHTTELLALDSNMLDFVTTSTLAIEPYIKYGQTQSADYMTQYYDCLVPNISSGTLSELKVRQALAYALDKREIISKALLGHAVATDYPIPLGSFLSGGRTNLHEYNLQKAIELLGEAGWKNRDNDPVFESVENAQLTDLKINLLIYKNNEDTYRRDVADNIVAQLINCGIEVSIEEVSYETYLTRLESGNFDLALCSFYLDKNPDPGFLIGSDGVANYGGYSDPQMDQLLQTCRTTKNDEDMAAAYLDFENYFVEQIPHLGLYFRTHSVIYDSEINIKQGLRDLSLYTTIPKWYLFIEEN